MARPFSHFIPHRFFTRTLEMSRANANYVGRNWWNGAFVPKWFHQATDSKAWQFLPSQVKALFPYRRSPIRQGVQQILRTPPAITGSVAGSQVGGN